VRPGPSRPRDTVGDVTTRYRCAACGNLTRFDVTSTRTTRAFHHFTIGGELVVEDEEVLEESVHEVACRWCGHGRAIEALGDEHQPGTAPSPAEPTAR
jgi:hypothetical protein